jgi:hypothetical protein
MNESNGQSSFLDEFKNFIGFLQNLWALLAGVSVLFPFSNVFAQIIPLSQWSEGGLVYFSPQLVTAISTVACLFVIFWSFGQRHRFARQSIRRSTQKQAGFSFAFGIVALFVYLVLHYAVVNNFYFDVLGWESGDSKRVFGDVLLLLAYSAFFVFVTRAFMLLGLMEYFGQEG